jgi:hypothetical protein
MRTNQPVSLTDFKHPDRVVEDVYNPPNPEALGDADANVMALDELRRKLCQPPAAPQKSRWRFW